MKDNDFGVFVKYYDLIYLRKKNYQQEAKTVKEIITQFGKSPTGTLLDVGCGTGEHVKYLSSTFRCAGIDVNSDMIQLARAKVPKADFKVSDMVSFRLQETFDVIICLFSSIGYARDFQSLVKTLRNFHRHLKDGGLVIVEPWVFKADYMKDHIELKTYETDDIKLVRMATSKLEGSKWRVFMHYLIGENGNIRYANEVHEMLAIDYPDYLKAFKTALFQNVEYQKGNLWEGCRGLFIAHKKPLK